MINAKLLYVAALMKGRSVIADMPHDRLIQLASLPDTALVKRCFTPAVTYYLRRFGEAQCHQELVETISALSRVTGIDLFVTIHVELPLPELDSILAMLRNHNDKVRLIRTWGQIVRYAACRQKTCGKNIPSVFCRTM